MVVATRVQRIRFTVTCTVDYSLLIVEAYQGGGGEELVVNSIFSEISDHVGVLGNAEHNQVPMLPLTDWLVS